MGLFIIMMAIVIVAVIIAAVIFIIAAGVFTLTAGEVVTCGWLFHKLFGLFKKEKEKKVETIIEQ